MDAIRRIEIEGFRGFDHLVVDGLAQINVIVGRNNVEKTALLEALFLVCAPNDFEVAARLNVHRGLNAFGKDAEDTFRWRFHHAEGREAIRIAYRGIEGVDYRLEYRLLTPSEAFDGISPQLPIPKSVSASSALPSLGLRMEAFIDGRSVGMTYGSNDAGTYQIRGQPVERAIPGFFFGTSGAFAEELPGFFSALVERGLRETLVSKMQQIDPRLRNLELLPLQGTLALHATLEGGRIIPVSVMGDGFARTLNVFVALLPMNGGCFLSMKSRTVSSTKRCPRFGDL